MRWGLIPFWAKDPSIGYKMINARAETLATKPAFRDSRKKRRRLIPADGFYEWKKNGKTKTPFCFTMMDNSVFAFAGIWDCWTSGGVSGTANSGISIFTIYGSAW
jgi:putative SOS response-associated peptidase YedK